MSSAVPKAFHTLAPFQEYFKAGLPILMYHKVGPRPRRVRLKGLYVSPGRFARQMDELAQAGYSTISPDGAGSPALEGKKKIVLTFDDGFQNVFANALAPMAKYGFHAIQFVVPNLLGGFNDWEQREGEAPERLMDAVQIRDWLAAGHDIGSHCLNHPRLTRLTLRDAREEISASKKKLEDMFGRPIEHFCYPYGDWNQAVRDLVMEAGYRTACTVDFGINTPATPPHSLSRILVRYPTRSLKMLKTWLFGASTEQCPPEVR